MTVTEAEKLIKQFECCQLPKQQWTHEAHFVMALWYCCHHPLPRAICSIKDGIKKYNISVGGTNTDSSGYHETITISYTKLITGYIMQDVLATCFQERLTRLFQQPFLVKDFLLCYYSKELLMSTEARKRWVTPDIKPLA